MYSKELNNELLKVDLSNPELSNFIETPRSLIDNHAPKIQKLIRVNNAYFMTKNLRRTVILKMKFRNKILKEKTEESKSLHKKHRNLCVSLLRKTKRNVYTKLHNKTVF